jgi:ubiquinone/menaquinone biosynthesis C-methylase UbiE
VDLACGTGSFINRISLELDSNCFGIDLSAKQIAIAKRKCRQVGGKVNFEVGDVLSTVFPEKCDLVTMNFDALNHLVNSEDWAALFTRVYSILKPGGVFFFDINSRYRLLHDWSYPEVVVKKSATYIQCPFELLNSGRIVRRQILMLIYSKKDKVKEHKAIIEQISMPKSRMFEMIHMSGFTEAKEVLQYSRIHKKHIFLKNRIFVGCIK